MQTAKTYAGAAGAEVRQRHPGRCPPGDARGCGPMTELDNLIHRLERAAEQLRSGELSTDARRDPRRGLRRAGLRGERRAGAPGAGRRVRGAARPGRAALTASAEYPGRSAPPGRVLPRCAALRRRGRPPPGSRRRCATACWPAASASGPCSRSPTAARLRAANGRRAAARRGDRADPHLLADPRRPARDGRRRPAPRPPDLPRASTARTWRSSPATRLYAEAFRHVLAEQAGEPANVLRGARPSWPTATGVDGMVGGQYWTSHSAGRELRASCTSSRPAA